MDAASALDPTRQQFQALVAALAARGTVFRAPPPEPTTCCGKGCQGCVWEGFYTASQYWIESAQALLASDTN